MLRGRLWQQLRQTQPQKVILSELLWRISVTEKVNLRAIHKLCHFLSGGPGGEVKNIGWQQLRQTQPQKVILSEILWWR